MTTLNTFPEYFHQGILCLAVIGLFFLIRALFIIFVDSLECFKTYVLPEINIKNDNFVQRFGKWAIVTGCTQGIGKAYAIELATKGMNLVLISRNQKKLEDLEKHISTHYKGIQCLIIAQDMSSPAALSSIIKHLESLKLDVGVLVNNVGLLGPHWMPFLELDEQMVKDIINVNVVAGTTLIHALLPDMIRKRKGAIINISSTCSAFPVPYLATYSATKHFIDAFTKAITAEYQDSGVTFQLVDPGQVDTQMTALFANKLTWSVPSPSTYVKSTIKRIGFSSHTSGYWPHSFQNWFMSFFPRCLISKLMLKEGKNQYNHALRMKL